MIHTKSANLNTVRKSKINMLNREERVGPGLGVLVGLATDCESAIVSCSNLCSKVQ